MNSPQPARTQFELKALLFVGARGAHQPFRSVVARNGHAEEKCSRSRKLAAMKTPPSKEATVAKHQRQIIAPRPSWAFSCHMDDGVDAFNGPKTQYGKAY